jgi:hypothetical protein
MLHVLIQLAKTSNAKTRLIPSAPKSGARLHLSIERINVNRYDSTTDTMTSRPTVTIHGADGAAGKDTHPLPSVFKAPIRPDIVQYAKFHCIGGNGSD